MTEPMNVGLAAWLREGPDRLAEDARRAAFNAVRRTRQDPAWIAGVGRYGWVSAEAPMASRPVAWAVLTLLLSLALVAGALVAGGPARRSDLPPGLVTVTTTPRPRVSFEHRWFVSELYDYAMYYPAQWTATPASLRWSPSTWSNPNQPPVVDLFEGPGSWAISVYAAGIPEGWTEESWIEEYVPRRPMMRDHEGRPWGDGGPRLRCVWPRGFNGAESFEMHEATIDGLPAQYRAACGAVDAVVVQDGHAYVISLLGGAHVAGADMGRFWQFAGTFHILTPVD